MKLEKINDSQILWSLDKDDMISHKIDINDIIKGTTKAQTLFQDALEIAQKDLLFDVEGYLLSCQLKEMNSDKITFSITRKKNQIFLLYRFQSLDRIIQASKVLKSRINTCNDLYEDEHRFCILMEPDAKDEKQMALCTLTLSEYGDMESITAVQKAHLTEHASCLIKKDAIQQLSSIS